METRIKYIKKNIAGEGYFAVQVKKCIFWKTIYTNTIFANVEKFIDTLAQIDEFNSKTKSSNKIVYNGWVVRNVYKNSGQSALVSFFDTPLRKRKNFGDTSEILWADCNDNIIPKMEIRTKTLFGKECLEPMKLRITIEQMEE